MLFFRGLTGAVSVLTWSFAVMLIPPSDVISLIYVSIVVTAVFSRIFMKEMLSFAHAVCIPLTLTGVFLIAQPEFIFKTTSPEAAQFNLTNQTTENGFEEHADQSRLINALGVSLALMTAISSGMSPIIIKHLANKSIHYSIVTIYVSFICLPSAIIVDLVLILTNVHTKTLQLFQTNPSQLAVELGLSSATAFLTLINQVLFNIAVEYEEPTRCSIVRSFEVFMTFIWQRIFLDIRSNSVSILGAIFIFLGALGAILYKELDKRYSPVQLTEPTKAHQVKSAKTSKFRKCLLFKV